MIKRQFKYIQRINQKGETALIPYDIGIGLGLNWDEHKTEVILIGNLAQFQAKGVILSAQIEGFD